MLNYPSVQYCVCSSFYYHFIYARATLFEIIHLEQSL